MPNLVAVDVSVADGRIRLAFSDRAVAAAYAAYLRTQDQRPPPHQAVPGYRRAPQLHAAAKEVSLSMPDFITWFITCRPDDEDAVTFTCMPSHECRAALWADAMLLFEQPPTVEAPQSRSGFVDHAVQLCVRRLWNRKGLLVRLEEGMGKGMGMCRVGLGNGNYGNVNHGNGDGSLSAGRGSGASSPSSLSDGRVRVRSPGSLGWVNGSGDGYGVTGNGNGFGVNGLNGGRVPVALTVPGVVQRGDIWW